jgi:hypothetical protein
MRYLIVSLVLFIIFYWLLKRQIVQHPNSEIAILEYILCTAISVPAAMFCAAFIIPSKKR